MKRGVKLLQTYTLTQLVFLWVSIGVIFAFIYYLLSFFSQNQLLFLGEPLNHSFNDFFTILYFSFITLTATGYGDVIPLGISRLLVIVEIFFGLAVFGLLISKIISARQQRIIEELYDISFEEKVNKLRSSLYVYRANVSRLIDQINLTRYYRRPDILTQTSANIENLRTCVGRIKGFLSSEKKKSISKVNELTLNLLFNSLHLSITSTIQLFEVLKKKRY
ncbi:MAG: ion channel, partial [Nanoarchaeota archaeon]|nr:ion channel [Nanoarchaeota archaeon]